MLPSPKQDNKGIDVITHAPKYFPSFFHIPLFVFPSKKQHSLATILKVEGTLKASLINESEMLQHVGLVEQPCGITKPTLCTAPLGCIPRGGKNASSHLIWGTGGASETGTRVLATQNPFPESSAVLSFSFSFFLKKVVGTFTLL